MAGKFVLKVGKNGQYFFNLKAANNHTVLTSQGYRSKAAAQNGIESVKKNSQSPERFAKKTTASGKFRFNLTSTNGQTVGTSQSYKSESGCNNGMKSVANCAPGASIVDQTEG